MLAKSQSYKNQLAIRYLKRHGIYSIIQDIKERVGFIGCSLIDYAYLHYFVKQTRPQYFLELGTGISTHVIAEAMNDYCYDFYEGDIKLVSMEENKEWYDKAVEILPDRYKDFIEIKLSNLMPYTAVWVYGTCYSAIPDYPYDSLFIDGPKSANMGIGMDYLRLLMLTKKSISAIIDGRLLTVVAFQSFLGKGKVVRFGDFHYIKPTSRYDMFTVDQDEKKPGGNITMHIRKLIEENTGKRCNAGVEWNV